MYAIRSYYEFCLLAFGNHLCEEAAADSLGSAEHKSDCSSQDHEFGGTRWLDDPRFGQINGATIKRSPGSTLKPFLYAMAMDQGLIFPQSLLLDIPTGFAGYTPKIV